MWKKAQTLKIFWPGTGGPDFQSPALWKKNNKAILYYNCSLNQAGGRKINK